VSKALTTAAGGPRMADPQALGDLLLYRLSRLAGAAGMPAVRLCEGRYGITRREWRMLALLAEGGAMHPSALAVQAQLDRARTSRALSALVAKGWVRRTVQASDQRYAHVELTDSGRRLHAQLFPEIAALNRELLAVLPPEAISALESSLEQLQTQADQLAATCVLPKAGRLRGRSRM
jgi:DNA-binding MarR family transcriptional regulator